LSIIVGSFRFVVACLPKHPGQSPLLSFSPPMPYHIPRDKQVVFY
jgi:hypothetical protein